MGLVDYSDSESDIDAGGTKQAPPSQPSKPAFQKFVSRSQPGKIIVSLPSVTTADKEQPGDEPPAKRAKTGLGGGGRFSNFGSFLPPPKATTHKPAAPAKPAPRPGVHLKTAAEPAFSREPAPAAGDAAGPSLGLPSPGRGADGVELPDQNPAEEEVKLVGRPLMFKPLSVARKPAAKKKKDQGGLTTEVMRRSAAGAGKPPAAAESSTPQEGPAKKKKISLFSFSDSSSAPAPSAEEPSDGAYEPLFTPLETSPPAPSHAIATADEDNESHPPASSSGPASLTSITDDLNLSAAARRELFGRTGAATGKVASFNMEREYAHNEALRAAGETVTHNPVRAIAPGKHSLRQLVASAQGNRGALEESFATARGNKQDAAGRYGWR